MRNLILAAALAVLPMSADAAWSDGTSGQQSDQNAGGPGSAQGNASGRGLGGTAAGQKGGSDGFGGGARDVRSPPSGSTGTAYK